MIQSKSGETDSSRKADFPEIDRDSRMIRLERNWFRTLLEKNEEDWLPWGPYLNDVYTIFGILDPLPPLSAFWPDP